MEVTKYSRFLLQLVCAVTALEQYGGQRGVLFWRKLVANESFSEMLL